MSPLFPLAGLPARGGEIIVVGFAGGGGSCEGIRDALGRDPEEALNHDPEAVAMHALNHPGTRHWCQNIWQADPHEVAGGRPIGLAWFSPDCKHFSKAKGGAPRSRNVRDLAWVVVAYARLPRHLRPRVIMLENVEEFQTWGPLTADGRPCPARKGETFRRWVGEQRRLGYRVEWRELRACDYGAPTTRKRLFLIARCDGEAIRWPAPTHTAPDKLLRDGYGHPDDPSYRPIPLKPWRTAADIIDWSLPCPSIFERARPLAEATLRRIAAGTMRYVVTAADPFIIPVTHQGDRRAHGIREPVRTITTAQRGELALVAPHFSTYYGEKRTGEVRGCPADGLLGTQTTENRHALVAAFLAKHYGGVVGHGVERPMGTVTTVDHHSVVAAHLTHSSSKTGGRGDLRDPLKTVTAGGQHAGLVAAFLTKYYGEGGQDQDCRQPLHTVPTVDRFGLVTVRVAGEPYVLSDIGLRMLTPRELFRAQGFPDSYLIDFEHNGRRLPKSSQVRLCGNSVCPPVAAALVAANVPELARVPGRVAAE